MMLSDVCRVHPVGGRRVQLGDCVLADRVRLGRPGSKLPLRASAAGLSGGISWRPSAYSLFYFSKMDSMYNNTSEIKHCSHVTEAQKGGYHLPALTSDLTRMI